RFEETGWQALPAGSRMLGLASSWRNNHVRCTGNCCSDVSAQQRRGRNHAKSDERQQQRILCSRCPLFFLHKLTNDVQHVIHLFLCFVMGSFFRTISKTFARQLSFATSMKQSGIPSPPSRELSQWKAAYALGDSNCKAPARLKGFLNAR